MSSTSGTQPTVSTAMILQYAIATFKGLPYSWGDNDCSGIVRKAYAHFGIDLPGGSGAQYGVGTPVDISQLQPGDLVFFDPGTSGAAPGLPGHVGIYTGNGMMFDAYNNSEAIGFDSITKPGLTYMGARRIDTSNPHPVAGSANASAPGVLNPPPSDSTCVLNLPVIGCLLHKSQMRALIGGMVIGGGGVLTIAGIVAILKYGLAVSVPSPLKSRTLDPITDPIRKRAEKGWFAEPKEGETE